MTHHEQELSDLKQLLLDMSSRAELAVTQAIEALVNRDADLARQVREADAVIDQLEIEIDDQAVRLLSHAPLASDLRLVLVIMRTAQNLERIADEAGKIANRARDLAGQPALKPVVDIPQMARQVLEMMKGALDAFVQGDVKAAEAVIPRDKAIDALNKEYAERLTRLMIEDSSTIQRCMQYITVTKRLERIADHATNIAEEVVFLCEAHDIRHSGKTTPPPPGS
jgi:phosphate transport system protein